MGKASTFEAIAFDAHTHVYRHEPSTAAEAAVLRGLVSPSAPVLDVGCAATGRTARLLRDLGGQVTAIDINHGAVREYAKSGDRTDIALTTADMTELPFTNGSFGLVLVGFHGFDYLLAADTRAQAISEFGRVLTPGGQLVLNTFNPIGYTFNPLLNRSKSGLARWSRYVTSGRTFRPDFIDVNGLRLQQRRLGSVVNDVERSGGFTLASAADASGTPRPSWLLSLSAAEPYLVFEKS